MSIDPGTVDIVRRLTEQNLTAAEIAARLGVSPRTVERYRAACTSEGSGRRLGPRIALTDEWRPVPERDAWATRDGCVRGPSGRLLSPARTPDGYRYVMVRDRKLRVHHAVLLARVGPCPPGMECRHLNGDPADNRLDNLRWGARFENQADIIRHGRRPLTWTVQLAPDQVNEIRLRIADGTSNAELAADFDVHNSTISRIRTGQRWRASA